MDNQTDTPPSSPRLLGGERREIKDHIAYFDSLVGARPLEIPMGKSRCSNMEGVMLVTTVGSGVGVCIHDPVIQAGGLGHLMLPQLLLGEFPILSETSISMIKMCEGVMASMILTLIQLGGKNSQMRAKLFGGGMMSEQQKDYGHKMYVFAKEYLLRHGIQITSEDIGQPMGRRIQYLPTSGKGMRRNLKRKSDLEELSRIEEEYFVKMASKTQ